MKRIQLMAMLLACLAGGAHAADPPAAKTEPRREVKEPAAKAAMDRLTLESTTVTGNRELPKVLYIVPWKKADLGDLPGQPFNTLLDEALTPVDREVFRREVDYYDAIAPKTVPAKASDSK